MCFVGAAAAGAEKRGEPFQPSDSGKDPRLSGSRVAAGRAAETVDVREQGAAQQPAQLSAAAQVRPPAPVGVVHVVVSL